MILTVSFIDKVIVRDGAARLIPDLPGRMDGAQALAWDGRVGTVQHLDAVEYFTDEEVLRPYLAAWDAAAPKEE